MYIYFKPAALIVSHKNNTRNFTDKYFITFQKILLFEIITAGCQKQTHLEVNFEFVSLDYHKSIYSYSKPRDNKIANSYKRTHYLALKTRRKALVDIYRHSAHTRFGHVVCDGNQVLQYTRCRLPKFFINTLYGSLLFYFFILRFAQIPENSRGGIPFNPALVDFYSSLQRTQVET